MSIKFSAVKMFDTFNLDDFDDGSFYSRNFCQRAFNLIDFNSQAAQLNLIIHSSKNLNVACRSPTSIITRFVNPYSVVVNKTFRSFSSKLL